MHSSIGAAGRGKRDARRAQPRKSFAESPTSPSPRSVQKKKRPRRNNEDSGDLFPARQILDEKTEDRKVFYLIDWEGVDPQTGLPYTPTWQPAADATFALRAAWQNRRREPVTDDSQDQPTQASTQESQPVRPAKRQRVAQSSSSTSEEAGLSKKPRRAGTKESARFQSVLEETVGEAPTEIKDSYEDQELSSHNTGNIQIRIPVREDFDRDAYIVAPPSSQAQSQPSRHPSSYSHNSIAPAVSPPFRAPTTPASSRRQSSYIWDEDIEGVVPDSQELGSSSYKPPVTPSSNTGATSKRHTTTETEADLEVIEYRSTQWSSSRDESRNSGNIDSQLAEPASQLGSASHIEEPSAHARSTQQETEVSVEGIRSTQSEEPESWARRSFLDSPYPSISADTQPERSQSVPSEFQLSTEQSAPPAVRGRETWSEEGRRILSQEQPPIHTPSPFLLPSSSLRHQTQLPAEEPVSSEQALDEAIISSLASESHNDEGFGRQPDSFLEPESENLARESQRRSLPPTERSVSWQEATWDAAKVISSAQTPVSVAAPEPAVQVNREDFALKTTIEKTLQHPETSVLSQLDVNTQRPPSKPQSQSPSEKSSVDSPAQDSSDLPSQSSENVLPSIERPSIIRPPPPCEPPVSPTAIRPARLQQSLREAPLLRDPHTPETMMEDRTMVEPAVLDARTMLRQKKAQLAAAREAAAASASASASASPSLSPAVPNQQAVATNLPSLSPAVINQQAVVANRAVPMHETIEDIPIPVQVVKSSPSPVITPEIATTPTSLVYRVPGINEYAIPLPMVSVTRDIYEQTVKNYRNQRYGFIRDEVFDESLVRDIDQMIDELNKLCDHQDLISDDYSTQREVSEELQAKWAENISTKCIFLAEFLPYMLSFEKHIAILVRPGRMTEILEAVLRRYKFLYRRADQSDYHGDASLGPMRITLIPTGNESFPVQPASVVIAFDSTSVPESYLRELRTDPTIPGRLTPLLSLVITGSIEHLQKCFEENIEPIQRKIRLVSCLSQIGGDVGKLAENYHTPQSAAKAVADYLVSGAVEGSWPLFSMPDIDGLDLQFPSPGESRLVQPSGSTTQSYHTSSSAPQVPQSTMKRQLGTEDAINSESLKRQRMTPIPGEQGDIDMSHVSDTVIRSSSDKAISNVVITSEAIAKVNELDDQQENQMSMLLKKINDLEVQLRSKNATESELREKNQRLEAQCQDYEKSINQIVPKYQEALNERGEFEHIKKQAVEAQEKATKERDSKVTELTKLREQKDIVDSELADARLTLSSSTIPEVVELAKMREEVTQVRSENERLQKRIENMQHDLEYARNEYQNSSTAAANSASELRDLQVETERLRGKADANIVRIHEIQSHNDEAAYIKRIRELKIKNEELERQLETKSEELKALMNGRRATRGTSVPRSPRMGTQGTMSPGPRRGMQSVMGVISNANGSRGNSPAPGEQIRGFAGEALFQGPQRNWGHHLQQ